MIFTPLNKHLLVSEVDLSEKKEVLIELPEDYRQSNESRYTTVKFLSFAEDCMAIYEDLFDSKGEVILVVDKSMIEEVIIKDTKYSIIHQNHVIGALEN